MSRSLLVAVGFAFCSCAQPHAQFSAGQGSPDLGLATGPGDQGDQKAPSPDLTAEVADLGGVAPDLASPKQPDAPPDLSMTPVVPPRDLSAPPPDLAAPPPDLIAPPVVSCHAVINEVLVGTTQTGTEEFVEIFNPCAGDLVLDGWRLVYRAASNVNTVGGADSNTLYTFAANTLKSGGYRVLSGSGWTGAHDGTLSSGIAASAALGLRDAAGKLVDSVAFGSAGGGFMEGQPALAPPVVASPGGTIARIPDGVDTDDNSHDFKRATAPTPGSPNR
jgi:hypothetical protein